MRLPAREAHDEDLEDRASEYPSVNERTLIHIVYSHVLSKSDIIYHSSLLNFKSRIIFVKNIRISFSKCTMLIKSIYINGKKSRVMFSFVKNF